MMTMGVTEGQERKLCFHSNKKSVEKVINREVGFFFTSDAGLRPYHRVITWIGTLFSLVPDRVKRNANEIK